MGLSLLHDFEFAVVGGGVKIEKEGRSVALDRRTCNSLLGVVLNLVRFLLFFFPRDGTVAMMVKRRAEHPTGRKYDQGGCHNLSPAPFEIMNGLRAMRIGPSHHISI